MFLCNLHKMCIMRVVRDLITFTIKFQHTVVKINETRVL
jgi:hypothetical protein